MAQAKSNAEKHGTPASKPADEPLPWSDQQKGVLHGTSFRFNPPPPALDRLNQRLTVPNLMLDELLTEHWRSRFQRFLERHNVTRSTHTHRLRWRIFDAATQLIDLVGEPPAPPAGSKDRKKTVAVRKERAGQRIQMLNFLSQPDAGPTTPMRLHHLYELKAMFELLPDLPNEFEAERMSLSRLLSAVVQAYQQQINRSRAEPLTFHKESQDYFYIGYKLEKLLDKVDGDKEKIAANQHIYDNYYHGMNYYTYSLYGGEKLPHGNQLIMYYCNAAYFNARIDWNGALLPQPINKSLPRRNQLLFLALRDASVLHQYKNSAEYAMQLRDTLKAFPT